MPNIWSSERFTVILITLLFSCLIIFPIANAYAQTCYADWDITGISDIKTNYQLGETISGNISFKINNPPDVPACIQQILVGIVDSQNKVIDVKCVYEGVPKVCPQWTTGTVSVSWESPVSPGTYRLLAMQNASYSCADAKLYFRPNEPIKSYKNIATITVLASKPKREDTTTGSSGSDTTQNEAASKPGASSQVIIVVVALLVLLFIFAIVPKKVRKRSVIFILILAVVFFLGYVFWAYGIPVITKWFEENIHTIIGILLSLGALTIVGIAIWKKRNRIWDWAEEILKIPDSTTTSKDDETDINQLCDSIKKRISSITIPRRHKTEPPYQDQLFQWLISEFPNTKWEKQEEGRRPDLVVNDIIAIEVKGPTTNGSLKDLITKTAYLKKYKRLICVLFEHDYDESKYQDITLFLRNEFGKRIDFIQKDSGSG
jgi:hypothetical protein